LKNEQKIEMLDKQHSALGVLGNALLQLYGRHNWALKWHLLFDHIGISQVQLLTTIYSGNCETGRKFEGHVGICE
jgi:hypothetical protein